MKKSFRRILCSVLSLAMCSTLVAESVLRLHSSANSTDGSTMTAETAFKDVTGKFDTSAIRESNFNDTVLTAEQTAPKYETRTVMVTLSGKNMVERANGNDVPGYLSSWSGEIAQSEVAKEQAAFLKALSKKGIAYKVDRTYDTVINAVAIEIDTKHVSEIKKMSGVDSVVITKEYAAPKTATVSTDGVVTNKTDVYATGIYNSEKYAAQYGAGTVVAVLDTGLDYTHNAFQGFKSDNVAFAWDKEVVKGKLNASDMKLSAEQRAGELEVSDVYMNDKVPFAFDYADDDPDVYPSYSNHGTHVAGIIGGYDPTGYTDKDGIHSAEGIEFLGVVPDAQLMICKVFTDDLDDEDLGGAVSEDIVAALEDCVKMGVDVINMSLGSSCGFTTTDDGDDEGEMLNAVYTSVGEAGISLICAASNDYSAGYGGVYGTNLAENPDAGTVGSPSTFSAALSVASINGQKASYVIANEGEKQAFVFFEEARDINSNPLEFVKTLKKDYGKLEFEYVVVPGVGHTADYTTAVKRLFKDANGNSLGRIALVKRGDTTFQEKVEAAKATGAIGIIVYNNVAGTIRMNLGEVEEPIPAISIGMNAGAAMAAGAVNRIGKITIDTSLNLETEAFAAGPFMSEFSSWGPTPDLRLKPEITAHGGEITSAVPGGYGEQSGTSMATPNMAGFMAIIRSYIKQNLSAELEAMKVKYPDTSESVLINRLAMQLTMSTAGTVYDQDGLPYSPRKQGAGVAKMENIVDAQTGTKAYLYTENAGNDYRPKYELFDDPEKTGVYEISFKVRNFSASALTFTPDYEFMTETLSRDKLTVSEQAHLLESSTAQWKVNGSEIGLSDTITVAANEEAEISVTLVMSDEDKAYIEASFKNGMYVEGFLKLRSTTAGQCDLALPFLGFYGDWDAAPMLDWSAYEVAKDAQDASVLEEDKIKASVWETQPFNMYYNEKYILPMGGYLYLLPDEAEPMYVDEEHNAISRYNEYFGEDKTNDSNSSSNNYMTTTGIKAVYAGLLRNAQLVKYSLYDVATGEALISDKEIQRVAKAYSGGGSAVPANVELEISANDPTLNLIANGKYRMEFEFFREKKTAEEGKECDDTFEFSFTVDYDAPVVEDVRVRYYNYKEGTEEKQRIYLDVDVYDNHYAQTLMLCYPKADAKKVDEKEIVLQLATEYPTPIRDAVKNGITTVSLDITDIYEKYGSQLYIQLDDYALNSCLYEVNIGQANANMLPAGEDFGLAAGEDNVNVDIFGTHKVSLVYSDNYQGKGDASNFEWSSNNEKVAKVKNGEIVGISAGTATITVNNRKSDKNSTKTIQVTVNDTVAPNYAPVPSISFGLVQTESGSLQKGNGLVQVNAGKTFAMEIETDPWYHPMTDLNIKWSSSNPAIATVTADGKVTTIKKGTAIIYATIQQKNAAGAWVDKYSATSILQVQNEFTVSNYTLTAYNGLGYTDDPKEGLTAADGILKIPTDLNVMYIGSRAFEDNNNIKKIIIPSSVVDIQDRAFYNCTALEEVYFVSTEKQAIADADLAMIYEKAFYGCTNLKKIDFSNVKTITVASDCFEGCTKLSEVVDMPSIGTMHHRAFAGTALTSVDLTGLHMSGENVFEDCNQITEIKTGKFTAIGKGMFKDCLGLGTGAESTITLNTPKIGAKAFSGCKNLLGVKLASPAGTALEFDIGEQAFAYCGTGNTRVTFKVDIGSEKIRSIGARAFANSTLSKLGDLATTENYTVGAINGLEILGENAFADTNITDFTLTDSLDLASVRLTGIPFGKLNVVVASGSTKYAAVNDLVYNADKTKLLYAKPTLTAVTIENTVTSIGDYALAGIQATSVTLPDSVTSIGVGAFKNAAIHTVDFGAAQIESIPESAFEGSHLVSIALPASVKSVGARAFAGSALNAFTGNGVESIGNGAFNNCAFTVFTLPASVTTLGNDVFQNCQSLTEIHLPALTKMGIYTFSGATSLNKATFAAGATVTGDYTFAATPITEVTLGDNVTALGEGVFSACDKLTSITLPAATTKVGDGAFYNASKLATVTGLDNVTHIGHQSFYNTALTALNLTSAQEIGDMAFAGFENIDEEAEKKTAAYTTVSIPSAVRIGAFAFYNGGMSSIALPTSVVEIGGAAFASADNLTTITVDSGNENFFVEENVLYRYATKSAKGNTYELVCYPTARVQAEKDGARTYVVKDGTARILAYAFYNLNANMVNAVVLPYSITAIGDSAFFISGITTYTFESIKAPTLETEYRQKIRDTLVSDDSTTKYRGYYNTNFQTYLYLFTRFGGQKSTMVMNYPSNGTGYTNPIYSMYFGVKNASASPLLEDNTRECIRIVESMVEPSVVATWASLEKNEANKKMVEDFANELRTARIYYNTAKANAGQNGYISAEVEEKLLSIERALRNVKIAFGLPIKISELRVAEASTHKNSYNVGETFDMTGLALTIVYDDFSTAEADASKFQLVTTAKLLTAHKYVEVSYEGVKVKVPVTVTDPNAKPPIIEDSSSSDSSSEVDSTDSVTSSSGGEGGFDIVPLLIVLGCIVAAGGIGVGVFFLLKYLKRKKGAIPEDSFENIGEISQEAEVSATEEKAEDMDGTEKGEESEPEQKD